LNVATYRQACDTFVVANMAKPERPEAASVTLERIRQLMKDVASWSDERVRLAVTDRARRCRFADSNWEIATLKLENLAVWPGMGGLPLAATHGSPVETARYIRDNGVPDSASRMRMFVDAARSDASGVEGICRALPLIAMEHSRLFKSHSHRLPWGLDDGSHRAVILALISRCTDVDVLIGTQRRKEGRRKIG
jgi:hypothetical protein